MSQEKATERASLFDALSLETDAGQQTIREQLERLLANAHFISSKRCSNLLRFLVESTLNGRTERLRERELGIDVFGRSEGYDAQKDPVVRMAAGDIRKRIAQYYHEAGHDNEIRIDLPSGTFVPKFSLLRANESAATSRRVSLGYWWKTLALAGVLIAIAAGAILLRPPALPSPLELFWNPLVDSSNTVVICVGPADKMRLPVLEAPAAARAVEAMLSTGPTVKDLLSIQDMGLKDAAVMARVAVLISRRGRSYRIQTDDATTLADLRAYPSVLIGAFNNAWTLRSTRQLRFTFDVDIATSRWWIRDRQNPTRKDWEVDIRMPYPDVTEDYAVVGRFLNPGTERMTVIAAGIGQTGTMAAGEFLTSERYMKDLAATAPANWEHKNFEAVIAARAVNGSSGPPRVLATSFW